MNYKSFLLECLDEWLVDETMDLYNQYKYFHGPKILEIFDKSFAIEKALKDYNE